MKQRAKNQTQLSVIYTNWKYYVHKPLVECEEGLWTQGSGPPSNITIREEPKAKTVSPDAGLTGLSGLLGRRDVVKEEE